MWGMLREESEPLSLTPHSVSPKGREVARGFGPSFTLLGTCLLVDEVTVRALRTGFQSPLFLALGHGKLSSTFSLNVGSTVLLRILSFLLGVGGVPWMPL